MSAKKKTMGEESSITSELIGAINLPNLKPIPSYLSESDAMTVSEYLQTAIAREYSVDTSNLYWGGNPNNNHVFDMFNTFKPHHDSVKTRYEMLQFVIDNERRYDWNGHLFLRMNNLTLADWLQQQTHFENNADVLSIYALSDMCGVHSTIVTKTKPWTTVHPTFNGDIYDVLRISKVTMLYLGYNRFARLWKKVNPDDGSYVTQNYNLPSMVALPAPPTVEELETAETLLQLQATDDDVNLDLPPLCSLVHQYRIQRMPWTSCVADMMRTCQIHAPLVMHLTKYYSLQKSLKMSYLWKRIQLFHTRTRI